MRHIRKPRRIRSLLPKPRLRSTQRALLSQQRKRHIQKNADNSSKPDYFHETARSTCCEPLSCVPGLRLPPNFRCLRLAQCQAHRFSLALKVDLQDCWMFFGETPQDSADCSYLSGVEPIRTRMRCLPDGRRTVSDSRTSIRRQSKRAGVKQSNFRQSSRDEGSRKRCPENCGWLESDARRES